MPAPCGCWYRDGNSAGCFSTVAYLPRVELRSHTTILSTASRTTLQQKFVNNTGYKVTDAHYTFPLFDGVSVVSFTCKIGGNTIVGVVKERNSAQTEYETAVARGESAGLFAQSLDASDVFQTSIGNIPAGEAAEIQLEYVGELKHDAELDGVRFTVPAFIAARYGSSSPFASGQHLAQGQIEIVVDVIVEDGAHIQGLSSPSHPIATKVGQTSTQADAFRSNMASASLSLSKAQLDNDFVMIVRAQGHETPRALLERHPSLAGHCALMTTLVPKFNLPNDNPEIVFVVDRSGSMQSNMPLVVQALKLFLRSLPYSAKFNICSFGSFTSFMFDKSVPYNEQRLHEALHAVDSFQADFGGTETLTALQETVKNRLSGVALEIMLLTDGEIWNQQPTFDFVNQATKDEVRLFSLGIGSGISTSLIEGLARAGNGFAQFARDGETIDKRVMRMLKGALSPHVNDYQLVINHADRASDQREVSDGDDFVMVETGQATTRVPAVKIAASINLFDPGFVETATNPSVGRYDHLPVLSAPNELQAPNQIGGLFSFSRTSVYTLLPKVTTKIDSVTLRGSVNGTPLHLEIPVQDVGVGQTIHQLAAKRAMLETEEGRGWLSSAVSSDGRLLKEQYAADWGSIVEREAIRLGVKFQIAGKFCSFVAVRANQEKNKSLHEDVALRPKDSAPQAQPSSPFLSTSGLNGGFSPGSPVGTPTSPFPPPFSAPKITNSGGLFGQATQPGNSGGMFGQATHTASTGGLFGRATQPGNSTGSSLFGSASASQSGTTGALFGNASSAQVAPSPFGSGVGFGHSFASGYSSSTHNANAASAFSQTVPSPADTIMWSGSKDTHASSDRSVFGNSASAGATNNNPPDNHALQSYHTQLMLLEQTNKKKQMMARQEPSSIAKGPSRDKLLSTPDVDYGMRRQRQQQRVPHQMTEEPDPSPALRAKVSVLPVHSGGKVAAQPTTGIDTAEARMHRIIALQQFDGSWKDEQDLLAITGVDMSKFTNTDIGGFGDGALKATVLALAWLDKHMLDEIEVWEMVASKARNWLETRPGVSNVDALIALATDLFL